MSKSKHPDGRLLSEDRPAEIAAWCARARTATDPTERAEIRCQLLLIGLTLKELKTHPALLHQVHDAWQFMRQQNIASGLRGQS